jgi:hypothetical protein
LSSSSTTGSVNVLLVSFPPSSETLVIDNFSDNSVVRVFAWSSSFLFCLSVSHTLGHKNWLGAVGVAFSFYLLHRPFFLENIATSHGFPSGGEKVWDVPFMVLGKAALTIHHRHHLSQSCA